MAGGVDKDLRVCVCIEDIAVGEQEARGDLT